jgi:ATP-dependent DNA ligase
VHLVRSEVVYNEAQWLLFVGKCIQDGEEGAVLKQSCAGWVAGHKGRRVTKAVRGIDIDLTCTGVILGTGKMDGLIAGLKFEWEGKPFTAGLGKGWDLEFQKVQTMAWSQDEFNVVGQIWRVTALQESSKGVLRLPKVGEMRIDKQQADA